MQIEITYLGVELTVEGTYEAEEPSRTSGPPEDCYEGSPSYFEIDDIFVGGVSIIEMFQCMAIVTNRSPIGHKDALNDLASLVCEICDNMEPDYDEAE
jgi:hypothetical protein